MEFHDILHGHIVIERNEIAVLMKKLLDTTELQRLRNMRQMNFDVPLIQELGRSRRLPHSVGVAYISLKLAEQSNLNLLQTKELIAAALLHDAAIPPYGHLVETEFKSTERGGFDHAKILESFIFGDLGNRNKFLEILPNRQVEVCEALHTENIKPENVLELVAPTSLKGSAIAAQVDIDNIDNVHRMAIFLGWEGVKENMLSLLSYVKLEADLSLRFSKEASKNLEKWLEYREKIYTMIIAHPECIPHNAFQSDLVELAVKENVISPDNWFMSEPEFEERLRNNYATKTLANQLLSGCEYELVDYVWFKELNLKRKLKNSEIKTKIKEEVFSDIKSSSYFVWFEKGLITRKINWTDFEGRPQTMGVNSQSCMIALVKKQKGGIKGAYKSGSKSAWRSNVIEAFEKLACTRDYRVSFPEDYSGRYNVPGTGEFKFEF
ncbi:MAG: HD domain-containing protein [Alteromonadaceae bacterium]|nr:HD domain-containing protein [Alteromonadaceae bacterium]